MILFNSDIDNFIGVKHIRNYVIASLIDEDADENIRTVGILSLFNKEKKIKREDLERVKCIQKFLGAAMTRVATITASLTILIGNTRL